MTETALLTAASLAYLVGIGAVVGVAAWLVVRFLRA